MKKTGFLLLLLALLQPIMGSPLMPQKALPIASSEVRETPLPRATFSTAYPNPFNPSTNIRFEVAESARVVLKIYNILGQEIETLQNGDLPPGDFEARWDAHHLASGYYFYHLKIGGREEVGRLVLLR